MSSPNYDYLDGNAAAGELSRVFAVDITTAAGRCAKCGTTKCLAEAHLYMRGERNRRRKDSYSRWQEAGPSASSRDHS
jgi:Family of unknown function (DUF6510)